MSSLPSIGVVIPTLNASRHLPHCLSPFICSPLHPQVLVVDSSSEDDTAKSAEELGAKVIVIPRDEFNHGSTRELARRSLKTDIVVMVTQDCYAEDRNVLQKLVDPILNQQASLSYARQRPHIGAGTLEAFARHFNYPCQSHIRGIEDIPTYGPYTFFCSNSCAAYLNSALDEIGGFKNVILGEDTVAAAKLLNRGHKIAYVAEATVRHSHAYTLKQEYKRHFDIGAMRRDHKQHFKTAGSDYRRGLGYSLALVKYVLKQDPLLFPYAAIQTFVKWLGYQSGSTSKPKL